VVFASVVVAVVLFVVLFSWVFQRRLIYLPSTGAVPSAAGRRRPRADTPCRGREH
jgi:hypothetical protein